jgi:hypothetical protein
MLVFKKAAQGVEAQRSAGIRLKVSELALRAAVDSPVAVDRYGSESVTDTHGGRQTPVGAVKFEKAYIIARIDDTTHILRNTPVLEISTIFL